MATPYELAKTKADALYADLTAKIRESVPALPAVARGTTIRFYESEAVTALEPPLVTLNVSVGSQSYGTAVIVTLRPRTGWRQRQRTAGRPIRFWAKTPFRLDAEKIVAKAISLYEEQLTAKADHDNLLAESRARRVRELTHANPVDKATSDLPGNRLTEWDVKEKAADGSHYDYTASFRGLTRAQLLRMFDVLKEEDRS